MRREGSTGGIRGTNLRRRVLRNDGSLPGCMVAAGASPLLGAGDEARTTNRRCSHLHVGHAASHALSQRHRSPSPPGRV
jgi:hypothetical protein